ncbi:MAG: NAD-dependent epimerase/dehydratase family protein [Micromonosporaceae bacterium]
MRVLLVGATGVVGRPMIPLLLGDGHRVIATTTKPSNTNELAALGAEPVVMDVLDAAATRAVVAEHRPEVIVHQATALSGLGNSPRKLGAYFAVTNRLRTEGTRNLLAAAQAIGGARLIAQSFCGWPYAPQGGPVHDETAPLNPDPPAALRDTLAAITTLERLTTESGGTVLRYGGLYGPGTSLAWGGPQVEAIRKRRFPLVGDAAGVTSFVHVADAAAATAAAVNTPGATGIYNVVDDEPAPSGEWVPYLAELLGAKRPWRIPAGLARILAGDAAVYLMTRTRGGRNDKAKRELGWSPAYPSWRDGFRAELAGAVRR